MTHSRQIHEPLVKSLVISQSTAVAPASQRTAGDNRGNKMVARR